MYIFQEWETMMFKTDSLKEGAVKQWWREKCQQQFLARLNSVCANCHVGLYIRGVLILIYTTLLILLVYLDLSKNRGSTTDMYTWMGDEINQWFVKAVPSGEKILT